MLTANAARERGVGVIVLCGVDVKRTKMGLEPRMAVE